MIPYFSYPQIHLGVVTFNTWGLLVGLGFAAGAWYSLRRARRLGFDENKVLNLVLVIFISSLVGARFFYALQFGWDYFTQGEIVKVWDGGLMFYGGFVGALVAGGLYVYFSYSFSQTNISSPLRHGFLSWLYFPKLQEVLKIADLLTPGIALGIFIGRIGCLLINDHLGSLTKVKWAIEFSDGTLRHPVIFYLAISNFFLVGTIYFFKDKMKEPGALLMLLVLWYSVGRLILDFFRASDSIGINDPRFFNLTNSQIISMVFLLIVAIVLLFLPPSNNKVLR